MTAIRPLVLAGGLGTRMAPRTKILPKPLLPIDGRPLLWYVLNSLPPGLRQDRSPIVAVSYRHELIEAYFSEEPVEFMHLESPSMAEAVLQVTEQTTDSFYFCLSADVLIPPGPLADLMAQSTEGEPRDLLVLTSKGATQHKRWKFDVSGGRLKNITLLPRASATERVALLLTADSIRTALSPLKRPIREDELSPARAKFGAGWILILKELCRVGKNPAVEFLDVPVCNVNKPEDLITAHSFVGKWFSR